VGAEALVRWEHPTRGLLGPATFIDFAEETSLIVPLGVAVLERACLDAASWLDPEMRISVNLSTRQLNEPDIVGAVARAITQSGLAASRLTLEITESVLIGNPAEAARKLDALKGLGVMIALDDFGTGFSSLSYLARFPVDMLKIDKSFIDALEPDAGQDGTALLDAIIDMSSSLRLHVIAEGIEGEAQAQRLIAMGCTTGQGFHFAEPMAHDELLVAMAANRGAEPASAQGAVEKLAARRHAPRPL
ncbi:MAG: hypothetical protein JWM47_70, partial [Acidimicrobiales bacterium]|nr:hypothetical protein [Acidimicrobiales bacterium]